MNGQSSFLPSGNRASRVDRGRTPLESLGGDTTLTLVDTGFVLPINHSTVVFMADFSLTCLFGELFRDIVMQGARRNNNNQYCSLG